MRAGIWVLCGFAAAWGSWGFRGNGWPSWSIAIPLVISAVLLLLASRATFPARSANQTRHIGRLILTWTVIEFVAIFVVVTILAQFGRTDATAPAVAIIVGLHFVALARGIPASDYYWTAAGMLLFGIVALFLSAPLELQVATFGSALTLWATAVLIVSRGRLQIAGDLS